MTISRRVFLGLTGAAVPFAAGLSGPVPDRWERLRRRLAGPLLRPGDAGYDAARRGFFAMYDRRPAAVAGCARREDVQACVDFAARQGIPLAARSGGHSYPGYSTVDDGLVADLARLNRIELHEGGQVTIGAGARLGAVYAVLAAAGRALPAGTCPTVGIAGLTLGGGLGVLGRKYGLTCDLLESAELVTADGTCHTVSAASRPELFWALRGGGGGNFGIVTSFTFRTVPAPGLTTFDVQFPPAAAATLFAAWQDWQPRMPDELWADLGLGASAANLGGCFVGPRTRLTPVLDTLVRQVGTPLKRAEQERGFLDTMEWFAGCGDLSSASCRPGWDGGGGGVEQRSYVATSRMLRRPAPDPAAVVAALTANPDTYTIVDGGGGAIARGDSAYAHRSALASFQFTQPVAPGGEAAARREIGRIRDGLGTEFGTTGYVNYLDPEMPDWGRAYYGEHLPRLRAIAHRYDPDGVFSFPRALIRA
ncbi:FAD/FMN-containing dehydrogenase [Amycolatopsis sulphurea]|uniref:FAD/FMN-containing dehydrogenase n=1 Tax=Amycolatopsis sulphurea TaxID=76022 RepID=A0A2A9G303_9PSEU|nr:FAD-binding oxidoreductase [Amycolatopsis sulphurea]PFG57029.1 FAD/FMN-containing dehydrogenase [Amycolatopsis sulphurea]